MDQEKTEVVVETSDSVEQKPKRRRRRTKAEIEADKLAKELAKSGIVSDSDSTPELDSKSEDKAASDHSVESVASESVLDGPVTSLEVVSDDSLASDEPSEVDILDKQIIGYFNFYERPIHGSYVRRMYKIIETIRVIDDFVQVQYLKQGYGLVKSYVLESEIRNNFK